jgi:membrane protease YdiL (CAAX protease family)
MKNTRILGEMALFFCAFFLPGYLSQGLVSAPNGPTTILMIQSVITSIPQFLLMIFVVVTLGHTPPARWGLKPLQPRDALRTAILVLGCFAVVTPFIALLLSLPPQMMRRLSAGYRWGLESPAQIPLALLFGLAAGYREEFFFRSYLLGRTDELGIPAALGVAVSTALFCLGHLYEGPLAVAVTAALGVLLAAAWLRCRNLHVVAIAHGAYNALVLCLGLLLPHTLPDAAGVHIF